MVDVPRHPVCKGQPEAIELEQVKSFSLRSLHLLELKSEGVMDVGIPHMLLPLE